MGTTAAPDRQMLPAVRVAPVSLAGLLAVALSLPASRARADQGGGSVRRERAVREPAPSAAPPSAPASPALAAAGRAFSVFGIVGATVGLAILSVGVVAKAPPCLPTAGACESSVGGDLITAGAITSSAGGLALLVGLVMTHFGLRPDADSTAQRASTAPLIAATPSGLALAWRF